jgi:endonuclease-3
MEKTRAKSISEVMEKLTRHYVNTNRTTLNSMRQEKTDNFGNSTPFKILISCLLSLRARDENTEKVSKKLFAVASTPEQISSMPVKKLEKLIFSSGHYHKKALTLKHVSQVLVNKYDGKVPNTKEELLSIKGIGPKTANIVLNFAFGQCVIPVDTHCHRAPNRLGWVKTKTPEQTERELEKILPKKYWCEFNALFVLFGREICQPVSPWCSKCPVNNLCPRIGVERSR